MAEDLKARLEQLRAVLARLDDTRTETEHLISEILSEMDARREAEDHECASIAWPPRH